MDDKDVVDDVNALLNLGVGDAYRLEHIKQSYIENKTIWITDENYLQYMRDKYLIKHSDIQTNPDESTKDDPENMDKVHCWKCGKKGPLGANFCMLCGALIFEVGSDSQTVREEVSVNLKNKTRSIGLKIPIMIGIPVLILIIIGGAYSLGYLDNVFEKYNSDDMIEKEMDSKSSVIVSDDKTAVTENNSKCGAGTVFDSKTNSCVLGSKADSKDKAAVTENNSKCGAGTVFDSKTNSCVLGSKADSKDKAAVTENNSKCGAGTVFDSKTNSCVLDK